MLDIWFYNNLDVKSSVYTLAFKFEYGNFKTGLIEVTTPSIKLPMPNFTDGCFINVCIEKLNPIVSDFQYDRFISNIGNIVQDLDSKKVSEFIVYKFNFIHKTFTFESFLLDNITILSTNTFIQITFLSVTVYLMQRISALVCSNNIDLSSFSSYLCNELEDNKENNKVKKHYFYSLFINLYSYIISKTYWIDNYIYNLSYNKLFNDILLSIYSCIKFFLNKFYYDNLFSTNKYMYLSKNAYVVTIYNLINYGKVNLNIIYSTLTVIYVIFGWILDYLSFMWVLKGKKLKFQLKFICSISFWVGHFLYALLYILWLLTGVFSTNGIYFSISKLISVNSLNIIMIVVGFIMSYISSNLWYLYGHATKPESFNLFKLVKDLIITPILLLESLSFTHVFNIIFNESIVNWIFRPIFFNWYSSLRRSLLEWTAFLGMVFFTYGTWNLYMYHAFYFLSAKYHCLIWAMPTILSGYTLIYVEEVRPRLGIYIYGCVYLTFWTSICFLTNSILVGYFNINNAAYALLYCLPFNFSLAFIYSLPLYREGLTLSISERALHLIFFTGLTSVTLISAGLLWYIIGSS